MRNSDKFCREFCDFIKEMGIVLVIFRLTIRTYGTDGVITTVLRVA